MVNLTTHSRRKQLEKRWVQSSHKPQQFNRIRTQFYQIFQQLFHSLTNGKQPRVWQTPHSESNCWNAYDPVSGCRVEGFSESEMRAWLEERYNR